MSGRWPVPVLHRSAVGLEDDPHLEDMRSPKLAVTSPPYPGVRPLSPLAGGRPQGNAASVHIATSWMARSSYYTLGERKYPELRTYSENIRVRPTAPSTRLSRMRSCAR